MSSQSIGSNTESKSLATNLVNTSDTSCRLLNDDVLIHIFTKLSVSELLRIETVSHQFMHCVGSALKKIKSLSIGGNSGNSGDASDLFPKNVFDDNLYDLVANWDKLETILAKCPNVESIYLTDIVVDEESLNLMTRWEPLKHLWLSGEDLAFLVEVDTAYMGVEEWGLSAVTSICKHLMIAMRYRAQKNELTIHLKADIYPHVMDVLQFTNFPIPHSIHIKPI